MNGERRTTNDERIPRIPVDEMTTAFAETPERDRTEPKNFMLYIIYCIHIVYCIFVVLFPALFIGLTA